MTTGPRRRSRRLRIPLLHSSAVLALAVVVTGGVPDRPPAVDWPYYGGDQGGTKFSPLTDINRDNVGSLRVAWEWRASEKPLEQFGARPGAFQNTPLMIDDVLYVSTPYNRVVALDAASGREIWAFDPKAYEDGQPPNGTGFVHRGVAAWRDRDRSLRIFLNSRYRLFCLDARTGRPVPAFGSGGQIDLSQGLVWPIDRKHYTNTSPPIVYRDLVIVGNGVGDRLVYRNDPPGDVRAFDARSGRLVWTFHPIPQQGEHGNDTWGAESWKFTGHTNVWAPMTLDERRGLLYLPVSTPSNDFYGGRRPGANLFAESLVCLDAATGKRRWHFQIVHHGIWDYDLPSPPNLVTIRANGRRVDAVVQLTKQGYAFVFDRVNGTPVWPIEERPVASSDVPGEQAWPTQPVPTRPPPFAEQGMTADDAFDLTPELKAAALAEMKKYRLGPMYTPPSVEGTLMRPGLIGGANWGGGAFDPETGLLYVKSSNFPAVVRVGPPDRSRTNPPASEIDAELVRVGSTSAEFGQGLPLNKPPYGSLTALDLNAGTILWRVPMGDHATLRSHPALKGVSLPERLGVSGAPGAIVTAGGLVFVGGGDQALAAFDKATGREVWRFVLPRRTTATPMTYRTTSGRQVIVVATGVGEDATLVAFAAPGTGPASGQGRPAPGDAPADLSARFRALVAELGAKRDVIRPPNGLLKFDYLVPSGPFHQLFDWDAYFMGVALSYDRQARYLASSVRNFLEYAGPPTGGRNGYTPRIIAPEGFWSLPEMCKPFLAQMTHLAAESMHNYWWVRGYYDRLARTLFFWENTRQTPDGLFVWFNGDESGVDNNPAVSWEPAEISESVDLVVYLVREYRAMAEIARALEKPDEETRWREKAVRLAALLNDRMWSESDGMYYNIDRRTGQMVKIRTWTTFVPLWAGLAPPDRAKRLIETHLLNPNGFWGPYGIRTLAPTEPAYNPRNGYWRGPTWVVSSYMMTHGLARYGYKDRALEEAARVTRLLIADIERTGGMNENYNPDTGAPAAQTNFVSWNLLAEHWVDEIRSGRNPIALDGK